LNILTPLLALQDLDLSSDRLAMKRRTLPERERLLFAEAQMQPLDAAHAALLAKRNELARAEHALGSEVAAMAARAKEVETTLYSGTVRSSKELSALQAEMQTLRERQVGLETRELSLLEEIDRAEQDMAGNRALREASDAEARKWADALAAAERVIDLDLDGLGEARRTDAAGVPAAILVAYEKLRKRERLVGRAVAQIVDGGCSGCRMRLPVHEHSLMQAQPEDALLLCVHCGRILVRSVVASAT